MGKEVHGGDIYSRHVELDFSANINPLGMPEQVRRGAMEAIEKSERYPDTECRVLRSRIADRLSVRKEQIICGNGAAELIFALCLSQKPQRALLVAPGFAEYEQALEAAGCEITYYYCRQDNGFAVGEDYLDCLTDDLDIVFLCNPNNPTGLPMEQRILVRALELCREKGILLVVDECFNGLLPGGDVRSLIPYLEQAPNLFILRAFTKLYAMAGLRLGYGLCADEHILEEMHKVVQPWSVSIPAQKAGEAAALIADYPEKTRAYVKEELAFLKEGFVRLGLTFWDSQANYLFFAGPDDLKERLLEEGILIRSCSNYRGLGEGYFRIAVRTRAENEQLLAALGRALG